MASYSLKALIDDNLVKQFNQNNQKVVIVKEAPKNSSPVAWVTFSPFEINTVSWEENYGVYASNTIMEDKAKIEKSSFSPASEKQGDSFTSGSISPQEADKDLASNTYEVKNAMMEPSQLTFSLAQDVEANDVSEGSSINAVQIMFNEPITPHDKVSIFIKSDLDDGMVIPLIDDQALQLDFGNQTEIIIKYDPSIGGFIKV